MDGATDPLVNARMFWLGAGFLAILDVLLVALLARKVRRDLFAHLGLPLVIVAPVAWMLLWGAVFWTHSWDESYGLVLPVAARVPGPPLLAAIYTVLVVASWSAARRVSWRRPAPVYALLGAAFALPGQLVAYLGLDMLDRVPALRGVGLAAALAFGLGEFVLYWCLILAAARFLGLWVAARDQS